MAAQSAPPRSSAADAVLPPPPPLKCLTRLVESLPSCVPLGCKLQAAGYPPDEAASKERLAYRLQHGEGARAPGIAPGPAKSNRAMCCNEC